MISRTNSCFSSTRNAWNSESTFAVAALMTKIYSAAAELSGAKNTARRSRNRNGVRLWAQSTANTLRLGLRPQPRSGEVHLNSRTISTIAVQCLDHGFHRLQEFNFYPSVPSAQPVVGPEFGSWA